MVAEYAYDDAGVEDDWEEAGFVYEAVADSLDLEEFGYIGFPHAGILLAPIRLCSGDVLLWCECDETASRAKFRIYFCSGATIPSRRWREASEVLRLLNLHLPLEAFTLDLETGIALSAATEARGHIIGPALFCPIIRRLVLSADIYQPIIQSLLCDEKFSHSLLEAAGFLDQVGVYPVGYVIAHASELLEAELR